MNYKELINEIADAVEFCGENEFPSQVEQTLYKAATAITNLLARAEAAEKKLAWAEHDLEAIMWHSGDGCDICAHKVEVHREPYVRLECALKGENGCECRPKWRGHFSKSDEVESSVEAVRDNGQENID